METNIKIKSNKFDKEWFGQSAAHMFMIITMFLLLFPLAMTLWCSFKDELGFIYTRWYPSLPLFINNYVEAFLQIGHFVLNTVFVAVVSLVGTLFVASLSAFVFARLRFPGKEVLYYLVIFLMMIPNVLTLIPSYMLYKNFGMLDTYWVLILPHWTGGPVFGTFLLRHFFASIPEEVFEAARIDGCNELNLYARICIPLSIPIMGTLSIMELINIWNSFLWEMITVDNERILTVGAALVTRFSNAGAPYAGNFPIQFAGYIIAAIPLIIVFMIANKYYIEGLTSSSLKL